MARGCRPVAVVREGSVGEGNVRFGEKRVEFKSPGGGGFRFRHRHAGRKHDPKRHHVVGIRQAGKGNGVVGIFCDRLLEVFDCPA